MSKFENPFGSPKQIPPQMPPPVSGLAVASLVVGILSAIAGLFSAVGFVFHACCCALPAVVIVPMAVITGLSGGVLGYFALQECKVTEKRGRSLAIAGIATSAAGGGIALLILAILAALLTMSALHHPSR